MNTLQLKTIKDGAKIAKFMLQWVKPRVDAINIDYDAAGGVKETLGATTVGDAALAAEESLSNLTKAELDDAMYALTAVLKTAYDGSYSQLEKLASRAENTPFTQGF